MNNSRIQLIEGVRGILALWVLGDHLLGQSGYGTTDLSGFLLLLRQGWLAVDVFIIISGFVIFYRLDNKVENYGQFIAGRFFRIWPLFIVLFLIGIPLSLIDLANTEILFEESGMRFFSNKVERIESWWAAVPQNIALHAFMMHGVMPEKILRNAPSAFLPPAWSISLEWQFYLLAPFVFAMCRSTVGVIVVSAFTALIFMSKNYIPQVDFGAFLAFHVEYFYLGCASYFIYKRYDGRLDYIILPASVVLAWAYYNLYYIDPEPIPKTIWIVMMGLLLARNTVFGALTKAVLENPLMLWLGRISYSVYLSHALIIIIAQRLIFETYGVLPQVENGLILSALTVCLTLFASHFLYKHIEQPGIELGKKFIFRDSRITSAAV